MAFEPRVRLTFLVVMIALAAVTSAALAQNHASNPYEIVEGWAQDPPGRGWGSTSAVYPASDGSGR